MRCARLKFSISPVARPLSTKRAFTITNLFKEHKRLTLRLTLLESHLALDNRVKMG